MATYTALVLIICLASSNARQTKKPHIFVLLVDDWGWGNVGYHRKTEPFTNHHSQTATEEYCVNDEVLTPNLDSLVSEGLEMDQHYAYKYCTPSRSSFLTGRLPIHVNDQLLKIDYYNPHDDISGFQGIPRNMTGIAEKMREGGYATHFVGKWDAGMATFEHTPMGRGFDTSLGYFSHHNDYYTEVDGDCYVFHSIVDLWDGDKPAYGLDGTGPHGGYEEGLFEQRVLNIIENHDTSVPLFMYYGTHVIHTPLHVPEQYLKRFDFVSNNDRRRVLAMVYYLDEMVGRITNALKTRNMWKDLLFIVMSDNGGALYIGGGANNHPLRGGKGSDWQGGVRVNALVTGGYLPEKMRGKKTEEYVHIADWYATFCALANVDPTDEKAEEANLPPIDSINVWPLISGQQSQSHRKDVPISYNSLISGDYKILTGYIEYASWTGPVFPNSSLPRGGIDEVVRCGESGCLYNIKDDPTEHIELSATMSDVLANMQEKLHDYQATYFNPDRGTSWPGACEYAVKKYGGYWGPFLFIDP